MGRRRRTAASRTGAEREAEVKRLVARLRRVLDHTANTGDLSFALEGLGVNLNSKMRVEVLAEWDRQRDFIGRVPTWTESPIELAAAGKPDDERFRSQWERRLAKAFDRLGIRWTYEPDWFVYRDYLGQARRYIPDFRLDDLTMTYVEVKGRSGADETDQRKMQLVATGYPKVTIVVWDAMVIEMIETTTDPLAVLSMLNVGRIAA